MPGASFGVPTASIRLALCTTAHPVRSGLNSAPTKKLNGKFPLTIFIELPQDSQLKAILKSQEEARTVQNIGRSRIEALREVEKLQSALKDIHSKCAERLEKQRKSSVDAHKRRTGNRPIDVTKKDYVLKALMQNKIRSKTSVRWQGPFRVTDCQEQYICEV